MLFWLPAATCVVRQSGTNFHRICKAQTPENSLSIALSVGYSSVRTAGGTSNRLWLEDVPYKWTYLLTYLPLPLWRCIIQCTALLVCDAIISSRFFFTCLSQATVQFSPPVFISYFYQPVYNALRLQITIFCKHVLLRTCSLSIALCMIDFDQRLTTNAKPNLTAEFVLHSINWKEMCKEWNKQSKIHYKIC